MSDDSSAFAEISGKKRKKGKKKKSKKVVIYLPEGILSSGRSTEFRSPPEVVPADDRNGEFRSRPEVVITPEVVPADDRNGEFRSRPETVVADGRLDASSGRQNKQHKWLHGGWLHALNIAFITLNVFAIVLPGILSTYLAIGVGAARSNFDLPVIHRGDLLVSKMVQASKLDVGTIVLLLDVDTMEREAHNIVSATTAGGSTTLLIGTDANRNHDRLYTLRATTRVPTVITVIPKFGHVSTALSSINTKIAGGFLLLVLNLVIAHRRRVRRRRDAGA